MIMKPSRTIAHVIAYSEKTGKQYLGLVQDDGGVRVDYHGSLEDLRFFNVKWDDPADTSKGGYIQNERFDLVPRYT